MILWYVTVDGHGYAPGYRVATVDTTGARDGFVAGLRAGLLADESAWESIPYLEDTLRFANAVGALTTTKRRAIPALPTREEVLRFIETLSVKKVRASGR